MKKNKTIAVYLKGIYCSKIFKVMRNTLLLTLLNVFHLFASNTYSQTTTLDFDLKGAPVKEVLNQIEEQSEFFFLYNSKLIDVNRKVNISVKDQKIDQILAHLFDNTGVSYTVYNRQIILSPKEYFSDLLGEAKQQPIVISGIVNDENGSPLLGATVVVKNSTIGSVTDLDGRYTLSVPANAEVLVFSYIGMQTREENINGRTVINITLFEETLDIDEVIVIGYGSLRRSDLTGAISSVKAEDLQRTPITSIDQGLIGRAAGVMVTQTSGMPGAIASIRVRGSSSLEGGNEPLYVIDGFPIYGGSGFGATGGNARISGLAGFNPGDIVSVEILKDASATAIYGARAANGVVLITTRRGERGRNVITFDANYGVQRLVKKMDVMNAMEYADLVNEVYINDGQAPYYNAEALAEIAANGGTDWQDEIFRVAPTENYQLSFSGGDNRTLYAISGNYYNQTGIIKTSDFQRYSLRVNFDHNINDKFKVGTHLTGSYIDNNSVPTDATFLNGVVTQALLMNPVLPVYANEENREFTSINSPGNFFPNPVGTLEQTFNTTSSRFSSDVFAEWEFLPNLKARISLGVDAMYIKNNTYVPSYIIQGGGLGTATIAMGKSINVLNENTLTWIKTFNDSHNFNVLAGFTTQSDETESVSASSSSFVNDILEYNNLGSGAVYNQPGSSFIDWRLLSYLGRINYSYRSKYLFSLNGRVDGSSRFGADNKYGFFPSGAVAWRISDEDFMQNVKSYINNLKLRVSYGMTGNTEIGVYNSLATIGSTSWIFGGQVVTGFTPNRIPNPDLKWEKTAQFNVGADIGFLNNRIRLTSDYYIKTTTDLLYSVSIPYVSGFATMLQNIGSVENRGFEFAIDSENFTGDFSWSTMFNIAFNKNKVLELGGEPYKDMPAGTAQAGTFRRLVVGEPIGVFYGYRFDGIFQNADEVAEQTSAPVPIGIGYRRYKDLDGDGIVDANNDREILGDSNPDFFGGFTNVFSFKNFELNVFLQYSYGNKIFNYDRWLGENVSANNNVLRYMVNRWKPDAPSDIYPAAARNYANLASDLFIEDASYLKLKSLTFSYNIPVQNIRFVSGVLVYLTGQNLITWTKYSGFDPDVSYQGTSTLVQGEALGGYPPSRTVLIGAKLNF
jgi:TonB-dependent starch-binding outer membrane protein SusC